MSIYQVNKMLYLVGIDPELADRAQTRFESVLAEFGLDDDELAALRAGDVATLYRMGVHGFLLQTMARHGVDGMTKDEYRARITTLLDDERHGGRERADA